MTSFLASVLFDGQVYRYNGTTWAVVLSAGAGTDVYSLYRNSAGHFLAHTDAAHDYYVSVDGGSTWTPGNATGFAAIGHEVGWDESDYAYDRKISADVSGYDIIKDLLGSTPDIVVNPLVARGFVISHISTWASRGHVWWTERASGPSVTKLVKDGANLLTFATSGDRIVRGLYTSDSIWTIAFFTTGNHIHKYTGGVLAELGLPSITAGNRLYSLVPIDENILVTAESLGGTHCNLWISRDSGATWTLALSDTACLTSPFVADGPYIVDKLGSEWTCAGKGGVFYSNDDAVTWTLIPSPSPTTEFSSVQFLAPIPGLAHYFANKSLDWLKVEFP